MADEEHEVHVRRYSYAMQMSNELFRAYFDRTDYGKQYDRKGHSVTTPKDPNFLSAREAWVARWQRITEEGLELGYIENGHCYECDGELEPTTEVEDHEWVYDETEEEYKARLAELEPYDPSKASPMDNEFHRWTSFLRLIEPPITWGKGEENWRSTDA